MNRTEQPASSVFCLPYTQLFSYQTHGPPHFGTGVRAPIFASTPMRTAFARGNCDANPSNVIANETCCGNYVSLGPDPKQYAGPSQFPIDASYLKMMRCKPNTLPVQ